MRLEKDAKTIGTFDTRPHVYDFREKNSSWLVYDLTDCWQSIEKRAPFFRLFCLVTKENGKYWDDRGTL